MPKRLSLLFAGLLLTGCLSVAQKYSPQELKEDLAFLQHQIFAVQASPFIELTKEKYAGVFSQLNSRITDSLTIQQFYRLVKPVIAYISDEHAAISLPEKLSAFSDNDRLPPFTLKKEGVDYIIDKVLVPSPGLTPGTAIRGLNQVPIETLVTDCSRYTTGFPDQRLQKAMANFGYLYGLAHPVTPTYVISGMDGLDRPVPGISADIWKNFILGANGAGDHCPEKISYTRLGKAGYINACTFSTHNDREYAQFEHLIDSIYALIQKDGIEELVIDVSQNGGGNSAVGNLLIAGFSDKPYRSYQCNWRRSDEYLKTIKGWGVQNPQYEQVKPGEVLHFDSDTVTPGAVANRFHGKVYVLVGEGTFSSAIMFATVVKDNHLATLAGVIPTNGHPTHFGEMYSATAPHTRLEIRFGVKEWIRPAGKMADNVLRPDLPLTPGNPVDPVRVTEAIHSLATQ